MLRLRLSLVIALVATAVPTSAQYLQQVGSPTFTTALPVELGYVNAANGNLHLQIPFGSFPERGKTPLVAGMVYDSRIWNPSGGWQPYNAGLQGGWRFFTNVGPGTVSAFGNRQECDLRNGQYTIYSFTWTDPIGTQRAFTALTESDPKLCDSGNSPTDNGFATDGSGYQIRVTNYTQATIYAPDGTQVYPSYKDTNGNYFSVDGSGNVVDPVGRTPVTITSNCNGNSNQTCYNLLNSQGGRSTYTVTTASISVATAFGQSGIAEFSGSITVISSILLPDNTSYQFGYDSYGELNSITLPTAGQIAYGYTNFQDATGNKNRWVNSRTSGGGTWSYTPQVITTCAVGCRQKTTVTKPSGDTSVFAHTVNNGAWVDTITYYSGAVSTSNQIVSISNGWDFSQSCQPAPCGGASNVRVLTTTTTFTGVGGSSVTNQTKFTYANSNTNNVSSVKSWKFYAGSSPTFPPIPDRETDFTYLSTSAYTAKNILNRVLSKTIKSSTGAIIAQTNFSYDDSGGLVNSSPATGIQNHDDTGYGLSNTVRGNLTTIQSCTDASSCASNFVKTTMTYDTTGQLVSTKDPNANTTNFGYSDRFFNDVGDGPANPPQTYSPLSPTNAYLTSVSPPLLPTKTTGYFYGTGQPAVTTDANGQSSYAHFFDSVFSRQTSTVLPNGGWSYTAYASETQVDTY